MSKKNLIQTIIFLGLLSLVFCLSYFSNSRAGSVAIIISEDGFSPEKITVLKGTTVTWVNKGERPHWPASNFHPKHNLYPESGGCIGSTFDACKGLAKDETFSFKMDRVGVWPVHDHLAPGLTMIVEVINEEKTQKENSPLPLTKNIEAANFRNLPYEEQLTYIKKSAPKDPVSTWAFLKESLIVDGQVVGNAHEFSHIIGHSLYEKMGLKGIGACDASFAFGCMHGVTEVMLLKEGISKIKSIEEQCLSFFPPPKTQDASSCIHGMGHGLFSFRSGDYKKALIDCDAVSPSYRQYCYDGVFMENSMSGEVQKFDEKNPWKFCSVLAEEYQRNCARYQVQVFWQKFSGEGGIALVGKNCALGTSLVLKETCFESLGYFVAQRNLGKYESILEDCQKIEDTEGEEICIYGGAVESVFQKYKDYKNSANNLCEKLSSPRQTDCFNRIKSMLN
ncbi:hypothetical protein HZA26_02955 [Candidatus Nomurabacteria bacterium]|nr:hypothetical protein [Candidatus Nomurabacteria bacterium]